LKLNPKLFVTLSELIYKTLYISCIQPRNSYRFLPYSQNYLPLNGGTQDMLKLSFENEYAVISLSKSDCSIGMVRFFLREKWIALII